MSYLKLHFHSCPQAELVKVEFLQQPTGQERLAVRGKTSGAFLSNNTFQWTTAVKALCRLAVLTVAATDQPAVFEGERGSLASSFDYALSKKPNWLMDMFGEDASGRALSQRLFKRTNPESKRPGPVGIAINATLLPKQNIIMYLDDKELTANEIGHLDQLILKSLTSSQSCRGKNGPNPLAAMASKGNKWRGVIDAALPFVGDLNPNFWPLWWCWYRGIVLKEVHSAIANRLPVVLQ